MAEQDNDAGFARSYGRVACWELARDCVWPDYIEKLINAARDLELRAAQLTGERAAVPDG